MELKTGDLNERNQLTKASAGTLESGDIFIQIAPSEEEGLQIALDSTVAYQFGEQIKAVIVETLEGLGINRAAVKATDKGALDCTIRARVTAAAVRATGKDVWK
jgi:citrate lyase subunit gamma (acyl carrier protein)